MCDGEGRWKVLEDNLRIPSGIAYAMADRRVVRSVLPELQAPEGVVDSDEGPAMLRDALLSCAPAAAGDDPGLVVLTEGPTDSAYFEHAMLAEEMGVPLLEPSGLRITDDGTITVAVSGQRIDVAYRRIDEELLFSAHRRRRAHAARPVAGRGAPRAASRSRTRRATGSSTTRPSTRTSTPSPSTTSARSRCSTT